MSLPHCHSEVQTVNNPFTDLFLAFIIAGGISIILLHTLGEVKTHRFCVCDPKATHTIAFIALPNALHSGTNGVNQILVGDADRGLLLTLRLGELVAPLLTTLTHTNRKNLVFCVKLAQDKSRISEDGNVYVIYTIKQMANDLNRSERTVKTALCELENAGLLTRVRQGLTKANRLFLQIPDGVQLSSPLMGKGCLSEVQKTAPLDGQKLPTSNTNTEYKEQSKTERVESTRRRYGEYQNVFLSGEEYSRLETAYPGKAAEYIERLSRYMASNDRHYANHYATIKKWLDEDSKGRSAKNYTYDDNEGECL